MANVQSRRTSGKHLTEEEVIRIRETIDSDYLVEGDLRREVAMNIKRLMDLAAIAASGTMRLAGGQHTHTNAHT